MDTTLDRLQLLLAKDYALDPAALAPDAPLDALGMDSLALAELMFTIEDEFDIAIPDDPAPLRTVGDVVDYIDALRAAKQAGGGAGTVEGARAPSNP